MQRIVKLFSSLRVLQSRSNVSARETVEAISLTRLVRDSLQSPQVIDAFISFISSAFVHDVIAIKM